MTNFKDDNLGQQAVLLNVDFPDVLGTNIFKYSLYRLLERENLLSDLIAQYKNSYSGSKAYPSSMLLRLASFAYIRGITSSRVIA